MERRMADISLRNVTKRFKSVTAIDGLSLEIADGEFTVLLGPTGAGKTTTLRIVAGLEKPDQGEVWIGGRTAEGLEPASRDVTFVFQQYSLYPHLSVFDNLAFPLRSPARRTPEPEIRKRVEDVASLLRIAHKLKNKSTQLSGGEMQRVAIGRALVRSPSVYLMDEPLSSLDAKLRADLRIELKRIQQDLGATILYVTHDQIEAMTMANRIGVIDKGRLIQVGSPRQIYEDPDSVYVAQRFGQPQINLLPAGLLPNGVVPKNAVTVGARTEHLGLRKDRNGEARVEWVEHLGDQNHLHLRLGEHQITTLTPPDTPFKSGDQVAVELTKPLYFDARGLRLRSA
jgi:multiple sugar transport system ATP-binding protein